MSAITITENSKVFLGSTIHNTVAIGTDTYTIPPSIHTPDGHQDALTNNYGDIVLFVIDYNNGTEHHQYLEGRFLHESTIELKTYEGKIRYFASLESPVIEIDNFVLENTNDIWYSMFHNHPTGLNRYNNILFSEIEIIEDITSICDQIKNKSAVYPNPSSGNITISLPEGFESIGIYDVNGRQLFYKTHKGEHIIELDQGTYLVRYTLDNQFYTETIMIY